MLAQGAVAAVFEQKLSRWADGAGGLATACGANALALGLVVFEDDGRNEIILPTYRCRSILDAVVASGASPILCDVGTDWVITSATVADRIGRNTKAVFADQ